MSNVVFTTARLAIRDFQDADLDEVIRMWRNAEVTRYMDDSPKSATESAEWLASVIHHNQLRPREAYNLAITMHGTDRAIGWVGFGPSERDPVGGTYGVGYLLDSAYWRQGYMCEALTGVAAYVLNDLAGTRLSAWCYAANVASARTLEKSGFTLVRTYCRDRVGEGRARCLDYELLARPFDAGANPGSCS